MSLKRELEDANNLEEFRNEWRQELECGHDVGGANVNDDANSIILPAFAIADKLLDGQEALKSLDNSTCSSGYEPQCKKLRLSESHALNTSQDSVVDIFISDLTEVDQIPFFDLDLPREVAVKIFRHLDPLSLCRCAQVSKAWKSLAEDELLWTLICQRLGYDDESKTWEKDDWKNVVKNHVVLERKIIYNWKNRVGAFHSPSHIQGGVLCSASFSPSSEVFAAGFSNGDVKLWSTKSLETCVFHPSSTALELNNFTEEGVVQNYVTSVAVSDDVTAAGFNHGFVDIWLNEESADMKAVHNYRFPNAVSSVQVDRRLVSAHADSTLRVFYQSGDGWRNASHQSDEPIKHHQVLRQSDTDCSTIFASRSKVYSCRMPFAAAFAKPTSSCCVIHEVYGAVVTATDATCDVTAVGVDALASLTNSKYEVKMYDVTAAKLTNTLHDHVATIKCINLRESPHNLLCTGSAKCARIYDLRLSHPVLQFRGHAGNITALQMDDWKLVSGDDRGYLLVWDQRMSSTQLWDMHSRHPVGYLRHRDAHLFSANIPQSVSTETCDEDGMSHRRYRGSLQLYDFTNSAEGRRSLPSICTSSYDEPEAYNYNINLAMPYDKL